MIFIAIPTYDGKLHWTTAKGVADAAHACAKLNVGIAVDVIPGDAFIGKARSILAHRFLKSNCRDLLFVDADVGFKSQGLIDICRATPPIVMGLYRMKNDKHKYPALMFDPIERHPSDRRLVKMQYGPAGFMRIRREVFEAMIQKWPDDYYENVGTGRIYDFFPCGREGKHFFGEDLQFCQRAQQLGFDLWAMQDIELEHTGVKTWESNWAVDIPHVEEMTSLELPIMEPANADV